MCEGRGFEDGVASALAGVEIALRLAIREVLPNWQDNFDENQIALLEKSRRTENNKRVGVQASTDLLEYLTFRQLADLILKKRAEFEPVFGDGERLGVLLGMLANFRNSIAHSRELAKFERDLFLGVSGMLRNQVAEFRKTREDGSLYYPIIESVTDSFNRAGLGWNSERPDASRVRIDVGYPLSVRCRASAARGKEIRWYSLWYRFLVENFQPDSDWHFLGVGEDVEFLVPVNEKAVGEQADLNIIAIGDSKYHRHRSWDDVRIFLFKVSPPFDE